MNPSQTAPIRFVFLDLGNVLFHFKPEISWQQVTQKSSLPPASILERFEKSDLKDRYESGEISTDTFFTELKQALHYEDSIDSLMADWNAMLPPIPENIAFARELSSRLPVGIISNTNACHIAHVRTYDDFHDYTNHRFYSHEVGSLKPHAQIYRAALAAVSEPPEACVFLDDRADNVAGARELGINAHLFPEGACLRTFWEGLGLE